MTPRLNVRDDYPEMISSYVKYLRNYVVDFGESYKRTQQRYSSFTSDCMSLSGFLFAGGYPFDSIRTSLLNAAVACVKVFELRGTEAPIPVMIFKYDPRYPPGDPRATIESRPMHPPDAKDFSLTNSKKNYEAVCAALIAGQFELAAQLASMAWDPPDAPYISPNSEGCTPNDQHLAYALKNLLANDIAETFAELTQVRTVHTRRKLAVLGYQASMVHALATNDADQFVRGLVDLLEWHEFEAHREDNLKRPWFYLCYPGLGLSALAVQRKLLTWDQLPDNSVYLPLELLQLPPFPPVDPQTYQFHTFPELVDQ